MTQPTDAASGARSTRERARALHQKGELAEAERRYRSILQRNPADVDALRLLGLLLAQRGQLEPARELVDRALGLAPARAELHFLRAELVLGLGLHEQALEGYARALALQPDYVDALINMGDALLQAGRAEEALALCDRVQGLRPGDLPSLNNQGNALQALGRHEQALERFDRVRAALPGNPDVLNNRACALLSLGRFAQAEADCRAALALQPSHAHALLNLGRTQAAQGAVQDALGSYARALEIQPGNADAWEERARLESGLQRFCAAGDSLEQATRLRPNSGPTWSALGTALVQSGRHPEALQAYDRAQALGQASAALWANRGLALHFLGRHAQAAAAYARALELEPGYAFAEGRLAWLRACDCDWSSEPAATAQLLRGVRAGERVIEPLELLSFSGRGADQLQCARTFARDYFPPAPEPLWRGERYAHERIRIAYLSADFREHPTARLLAGLLEAHDRTRFEVFAVSFGPDDAGPMAARIASAIEHFVPARDLGERQIAELLRAHEIDIAVDLMGYTTLARPALYALRPCPVQVNYLGFPATMGTPFIDYLIGDHYVVPEAAEADYEEKVVRLPECFQANDHARPLPPAPQRSELRLPGDAVVYCSMNKGAKLNLGLFARWMEILHAVPGSVLWLIGDTPALQHNLQSAAGAHGVHPSRLVFAGRVAYADHLARLQQADVALDTLPFNGGATTSDALRAGIPVVASEGEAFASRMSGSLLHALGLPELVAPSPEAYVALAIRLGLDADERRAVRGRLAANLFTHPLFDTDRLRGHLEAAYELMWRRAQQGEPPAGFSVDPLRMER